MPPKRPPVRTLFHLSLPGRPGDAVHFPPPTAGDASRPPPAVHTPLEQETTDDGLPDDVGLPPPAVKGDEVVDSDAAQVMAELERREVEVEKEGAVRDEEEFKLSIMADVEDAIVKALMSEVAKFKLDLGSQEMADAIREVAKVEEIVKTTTQEEGQEALSNEVLASSDEDIFTQELADAMREGAELETVNQVEEIVKITAREEATSNEVPTSSGEKFVPQVMAEVERREVEVEKEGAVRDEEEFKLSIMADVEAFVRTLMSEEAKFKEVGSQEMADAMREVAEVEEIVKTTKQEEAISNEVLASSDKDIFTQEVADAMREEAELKMVPQVEGEATSNEAPTSPEENVVPQIVLTAEDKEVIASALVILLENEWQVLRETEIKCLVEIKQHEEGHKILHSKLRSAESALAHVNRAADLKIEAEVRKVHQRTELKIQQAVEQIHQWAELTAQTEAQKSFDLAEQRAIDAVRQLSEENFARHHR